MLPLHLGQRLCPAPEHDPAVPGLLRRYIARYIVRSSKIYLCYIATARVSSWARSSTGTTAADTADAGKAVSRASSSSWDPSPAWDDAEERRGASSSRG